MARFYFVRQELQTTDKKVYEKQQLMEENVQTTTRKESLIFSQTAKGPIFLYWTGNKQWNLYTDIQIDIHRYRLDIRGKNVLEEI